MRVFACGRKKRQFSTVAFDGTARLAAGGGSGETVVWNLASGDVLARLERTISFDSQSLHFRNGHLLLPTIDGLVACAPATGEERVVLAGDWFVTCVALDPTGNWGVLQHNGGTGSAWLMSFARPCGPRQREGWSVCLNDRQRRGSATDLAVLPGGKRFLTAEFVSPGGGGAGFHQVTTRDRKTGDVLSAARGLVGFGDRVCGSPFSHTFVVLNGSLMRVYDSRRLTAPPHEVRSDGKKHLTAAAFHPSGNYLLAASNDETVKLYDARTWGVVRSFTWEIGRMRCVAFSPDGTLAAAGGETGQVVVWDVDV